MVATINHTVVFPSLAFYKSLFYLQFPMGKYLLLLILCLPFCAAAQDTLVLPGLLWEDAGYNNLPQYPAETRGGIVNKKVDLRPYCPAVSDQCDQQSCVGIALGNALTIRWAVHCNDTNTQWIATRRFSPAYIYNQIKEGKDCQSGAYLHKGLQMLKTQGICLLKTFPYDCNDCNRQPNTRQRAEAKKYTIRSYERVFPLDADSSTIINNTLYALDYENPLIVGMMITPNFQGLHDGTDRWKPFPVGGGTEGHALVAVGYDEDAGMITLFNSYGSDWGKSGFIRMTFGDFVKQVKYAAVVELGEWADKENCPKEP